MTDVATKNWHIVHTYSGFEKKVAESLQQRVQAYGLQNEIGEILIPTEDVVEMRAGKKVVTAKRFFPGYILVEMNMSDHAWHVVKNTPKVTGFVGAGRQADAVEQGRGRTDPDASENGRREAKAEVHVRKGRAGADQRRPVHQFQRRGRRGEPRQEHAEGDGDDLRTIDAGGTGFPAGGEDLKLSTTEDTEDTELQQGSLSRHSSVSSVSSVVIRSVTRWQKIQAMVKLQIAAGKATPAPPVGTALGPQGVNIMDFCKNFNARTAKDEGLIIPVVVTVYADRSYSFITKTPPAAVLLKRAANIAKGSAEPNKTKVGTVTAKQVEDIARTKMPDLNCDTPRVGDQDGCGDGALDGAGCDWLKCKMPDAKCKSRIAEPSCSALCILHFRSAQGVGEPKGSIEPRSR